MIEFYKPYNKFWSEENGFHKNLRKGTQASV